MAVREPDFLGLLVHLLDKGRLAAGQAFGQHDAGVVAGLDDHAADQIGNLDPRSPSGTNIFDPPVRQALSLTGSSSSSLARPCFR